MHSRASTSSLTDAASRPERLAPRITVAMRWQHAAGVELMGPVLDSGMRDPVFLVSRSDGQVVQLSELLYLVLSEIDPDLSPEEVCEAVSSAYGRQLTVEGLDHLVRTKLAPLGLVHDAEEDGEITPAPVARPILSLTLKGTLLPARATQALASVLRHMYHPVVVALVLASFVTLDVVVLARGDFWSAVTRLFATPTLLLAMYGLLTLGALIHEVGHAAACRYGGARPGAIGFGIYVVFPAFYTDVTDSYRLSRGGRLRVDLGGLYFNLLCVLALGALYLGSGDGLFLLTLVLMQIQMLQQLTPVVRFDGYYVLADLAGVPDLFSRVGPVLRSLRPGSAPDPRVAELSRAARRLVVGWVLVVVPCLTAAVVWLVWHLPEFVARARAGFEIQTAAWSAALPDRDLAMLALSALSIVLIFLPLLGIVMVAARLLRSLVSIGRARSSAGAATRRLARERQAAILLARQRAPLTAEAFSDEHMLAPSRPAPSVGWRKSVLRASGGKVNLGPGPIELEQEDLRRRLRTPLTGSRRVVVMSRKGGVGKTTMTLALGSTFAVERGDRVVAVDANPDAGNLAHRVGPPCDRSITDVLRDLDEIGSYSQLRSYTSQAAVSRLEVLASDDDPHIEMALDRTDYHRLIGLLDRFYNLILLDTGTGILESANQGLMAEADQLVLVVGPGLDGGRAAALTLDWMEAHDLQRLVDSAIVVINGVRSGAKAPTEAMRRHFEKRCAAVVMVPWDPALVAGARTDLDALRRRTRDSLIATAAAVADNFHENGGRP
jgi:putative peptide zinc metalloprotease protein